MLKKSFTLILIFTSIVVFLNRDKLLENKNTLGLSSYTSSQEEGVVKGAVEIGEHTINSFEVNNLTNLLLIPNFTEEQTTREAKQKFDCKNIVNAGFYGNSNEMQPNSYPIGLFIHDYQVLSKWQKNSLFNGILSINDFATPRITRNAPQDALRIALQTGPLLAENGQFMKLELKSDKPARRVVALITGENKLIFLVIYSKASAFEGPYLADLPEILKNYEYETKVEIADAINLDGGSASAFISDYVSISEATMVGSFFCEKSS